MALGEVDLGLMGVVGGLAGFVSFFNGILATAVGRFYAYSVGQAMISGKESEGLEECRHWFNTALTVHTIVPIVLVVIGYPLGEWAVRNFLTIPANRIADCVWVWRFVCVSCFAGMVNVPFRAMYTAKQEIAELTIYGFATTTLNACFLYYMVTHPGVWLAKFSLFTCFLLVVPKVIICVRALCKFPECRIRWAYMGDVRRIWQVSSFAGWQFFGILGSMLRGQGIQVLTNKYFGPRVNAGMGIAGTVNSHAMTLAGAMNGAFAPAITNACGAGELDRMRRFAYRVCKFGMAISLVFFIPLALEIDEVMILWLKNPPAYTIGFCLCMMIVAIADKASAGHMMAVNAQGKIARYQLVVGMINLFALPLAWGLAAAGLGPYSIVIALIAIGWTAAFTRAWLARSIAGMSVRYWLLHILVPVGAASAVGGLIGWLPHFFLQPSFGRVVLTTGICEVVYVPLLWFVILDMAERTFVIEKMRRILKR